MELTPDISEFLPFQVGIAAVAQLFEVFASVGRVLREQFNDHLLRGSIDVDIQPHIFSAGCVLDKLSHGIGGFLLVDDHVGLVDVAELGEHELVELICVAHVHVVVVVNQWRLLVRIEHAFLIVLKLPQVFFPLRLEKLEDCHFDVLRVVLLQVPDTGHTLMEEGVVHTAC